MDVYYLWFKALHLISVIAWMAGMLYLPRLFVYHAEVEVGSPTSELFKVMERRLLRYIINPAMIATFIFGGILISIVGMSGGWLHIKLLLLVFMAAIHGMLARHRKQFERDENTKSSRYYRVLNEAPTVLLVIIVLLAVIKPF
jgi:putative membrane protein